MITKKNTQNFFYIFIIVHLIIWTLIPSLSNINLPLDTIEALAWGSDLKWGFNKHPPFSAFAAEIFYQIFGNQDWAFYFLSQIFVIFSFFIVFIIAKELFSNLVLAFLSVLLLEGVFFYNYTTPEFNVNIAQLPFWALSIYYTWRCNKNNNFKDFILLGLFIGLGFLSKYLFIYLILGIYSYLFYLFYYEKKINLIQILITTLIVIAIITPHFHWLINNNVETIAYGLRRAGGIGSLFDHISFPVIFILKQVGMLLPFFLLFYSLLKNLKSITINKNEKNIFLFFTFLIPILLIIGTSMLMGVKIRTMWMTPFYLLIGIVFIQLFLRKIDFVKLKKFYLVFLFFFMVSPIFYLYVSLTNDFKRTDYPGKEIARLVQNKWDNNFSNEIKIVVGDEWFAGNLSYHLNSRPRWVNDFKGGASVIKREEGVIYTGNPKILKKICPGVYGTIRPVGYCMIGTK